MPEPTLDHIAMQQTFNINYSQLLIQGQNNCANTWSYCGKLAFVYHLALGYSYFEKC